MSGLRRAQAKVARRRGEWEQAREERRRAIQQALKSGEILAAIGRVLGVSRQRVKRLAEGE